MRSSSRKNAISSSEFREIFSIPSCNRMQHLRTWVLKNKNTHSYCLYAAAAAKSLQSCPTLCDPIDGSPPGSAVPGILQARTLEWVLPVYAPLNISGKNSQKLLTLAASRKNKLLARGQTEEVAFDFLSSCAVWIF